MHKRGSGTLLHIVSLPSRFGIGDLGYQAYKFADFLASAYQSYWQLLPLNPSDLHSDFSPYSSFSSFALNPLFLSPDLLIKQGYITDSMVQPLVDCNPHRVAYNKSIPLKMQLLEYAFTSAQKTNYESDYSHFCEQNAFWLDDHALFAALSNQFSNLPWNQWSPQFRDRDPAAILEFKHKHHQQIQKEKFVQYLLMQQWTRLHQYCNNIGIQLIGDLPMFVSYNSVDVWANRQIFKLDTQLQPAFFAGAPPDRFCLSGQLWHNPVYDWDTLKKENFLWWVKRFHRSFELFDLIRIDHFRGLIAYWETPANHLNATGGKWQNVPVDEFFNTMFKHFFCFPVIAEDLGTITSDVREAMNRFQIPGTKVLLFAFENQNPHHPYLPHNYEKNCMACTGTHDTNTILGWYSQDCSEKERQNLLHYLGEQSNSEPINWKAIRLMMQSAADLVIFPLQDILGYGSDTRMNIPGTRTDNWRWRFTEDALTAEIQRKWADLTMLFGRA
ncbi:MAG TPA: 4-alpha-glucanotransferase [Chitinispirillaceae bacterium]|nr:4-alpha-glucanotransferase [Chitinispirillaceae bacterium]